MYVCVISDHACAVYVCVCGNGSEYVVCVCVCVFVGPSAEVLCDGW